MVHFACGDATSAKRLETFDVVADVASARARRFRGGVRDARAPLQVWKSRFGGYAWAGARQGAFARTFCDLNGVSSGALDALNAFDGPVIEVHISNIHRREAFRHHSYVSQRADGVIAGCGTQGYTLALRRIAVLLDG